MEKEKVKREPLCFLTMNYAGGMEQMGLYSDPVDKLYGPDVLLGKKFYEAINNKALIRTLKDMGVIMKPVSSCDKKFTAVEGDFIFSIHPSTKIFMYAKSDKPLPQDITFTVDVRIVKRHTEEENQENEHLVQDLEEESKTTKNPNRYKVRW